MREDRPKTRIASHPRPIPDALLRGTTARPVRGSSPAPREEPVGVRISRSDMACQHAKALLAHAAPDHVVATRINFIVWEIGWRAARSTNRSTATVGML